MAGSPYATLAGVLRADVDALERAWFDHTSRHRCRAGECEAREALDAARKKFHDMLKTASSSPAPQVSVTFMPLPAELKAELT